MTRQLDLLRRVVDLLGVVARNEPTAGGELHIPIIDLTLPARGWVRFDEQDEQVGDPPIATRLTSWWLEWTGGEEYSRPDTWRIAGLLLGELPTACQDQPEIAAFAAQLRKTYGGARRALGRDMRPVRYTKPCPECGADGLTRYPGDWIECGRCERLWDDPDFRLINWGEYLWVRQFVEPWTELDSTQAAMYAGVELDTIRQWVRRNQLSPIRPALRQHPRFWALEIDRCQAVVEERARRVAERKAQRVMVVAPGRVEVADDPKTCHALLPAGGVCSLR